GEGAYLLNSAGERFMERYHPMRELAPRDVVARAIVSEMRRTHAPHVFLDLTHRPADFIRERFPRIHQTCLQYGVDISTTSAPVHPAAHYAMGGVRTDLYGRASIPRLYAAGEAACTGVHGANRLASNSLLEGVVFGARSGIAMRETGGRKSKELGIAPEALFPRAAENEVRNLAWENCGIARDRAGLTAARELLASYQMLPNPRACLAQYDLRSIQTVALSIARCALAREESRGAHFRTDFPERRPEFAIPSIVSAANER
ncbi:MAG: FAD-binding protein, partial [Acidobacteriota bacterium]|nr:FAD-binding protein [Acidobacteriota bacterium]